MKLCFHVVILQLWNTCCYISCNASSWSLFNHMATKTPYFKHPMSSAHDALPVDNTNIIKGYEVVHMDALYRHGTRYPGKGKLAFWKSVLEKLSHVEPTYNIKDILKSWDHYFPPKLNYTLHEVGWTELQNLAKQSIRISGSFYTKIFETYRKGQYSDQPSCNKFQQSHHLQDFTENVITYGGITMIIDRKKLRPFDSCERFLERVKNNQSSEAEYQKFMRSKPFDEARYAVSNYFAGRTLTSAEVYGMYQLCTFLLALYDNTAICNFFNDEQMKVMEYAADLKHYYQTGYGYPINYQFSCQLLYDVIARLERVKNTVSQGKTNPSVILRFGHAETLIPLLCLLGLYKDEARLTSASFEMHKESRLFRTGTFSPFAGYVTFILFRSVDKNAFKIGVVVSGQYMKLPLVGDCHLCDYRSVLEYFREILGQFNCNTVCEKVVHDEL